MYRWMENSKLNKWSTRFQMCLKVIAIWSMVWAYHILWKTCGKMLPVSWHFHVAQSFNFQQTHVITIAVSDMRHNFNSTGIQKSATVMCMSYFKSFLVPLWATMAFSGLLERSRMEEEPQCFDQTISWCVGMFTIYLQNKFHMPHSSYLLVISSKLKYHFQWLPCNFTFYMKYSLIKAGLFFFLSHKFVYVPYCYYWL